jgi:hypothetical protein
LPTIFEVFGYPIASKSEAAQKSRKAAHCPFMNQTCDGGGNRHMAAVNLSKDKELAKFFGRVDTVHAGVCSITTSDSHSPWIVCPRRLFYLQSNALKDSSPQKRVQEFLFDKAGLDVGDRVGVWSEMKLKARVKEDGKEGLNFDYTFDFVLSKLGRVSANEVEATLEMGWDEAKTLLEKAGLTFGAKSGKTYVADFPIGNPIIIEVMTSSTSGGNKTDGTTITNAFKSAILGLKQDSPGINYRQVWARMVSQLIVKSEAARSWGGVTFWIVQDTLLDYMQKSTALNLASLVSQVANEVNIISVGYDRALQQTDTMQPIEPKTLYAGPIGEASQGSHGTPFYDLLRGSHYPSRPNFYRHLLKKPVNGAFMLAK